MVVMVFDSILALLVDPPLSFVHPYMIVRPLLPEYFSFNVDLVFEIITQLIELILKFVLEFVYNIMHVVHAINSILPVLSDFGVCVIELLLHLSFVFNTSIL